MDKKYHYLVLFSGGFDSTTLLHMLAKKGNCTVDLLYVSLKDNNPDKVQMEEESTRELVKLFHKEFPGFIGRKYTTEMSITGCIPLMAQSLMWMFSASGHSCIGDYDGVLIAYLKGDDAPVRIEAIRKVWYGMQDMVMIPRPNVEVLERKAPVRIEFPLLESFTDKKMVLEYLRAYPEFYNLAQCCEYGKPNSMSHCSCVACTKHRHTLLAIEDSNYASSEPAVSNSNEAF